jgi:hypothetical protein
MEGRYREPNGSTSSGIADISRMRAKPETVTDDAILPSNANRGELICTYLAERYGYS